MRVSPNLEPSVLAGIQQSEAALQTALQQVSTGLRVNQPGDDPTASAALVQNLNNSSNIDQYTKNGNAALGAAQTADSVLASVVSLLTQAITLGTEGASGVSSATNQSGIATQIRGILASVVSEANTNYQGVSLFAGTSTVAAAFTVTSSGTGITPTYSYQGNSGINQVQVGSSLQVQGNIGGGDLFANPAASVIGSLTQLANALDSNASSTDIGTAVAAVTTALNYVSSQHSVYGNTINQLNSQETFLSQEKVTLSAQATSLVGVDTATAAENLVQAEAQNSAVLAAAAKVLPTTLLDYLK